MDQAALYLDKRNLMKKTKTKKTDQVLGKQNFADVK